MMIRRSAISFLIFTSIVASYILATLGQATTHAWFNDAVHPEVNAVAASLDFDLNGDLDSTFRYSILVKEINQTVESVVTITNLGTISGEISIEPSEKNPAFIKVLSGKFSQSDFDPKMPTKFPFKWEIVTDATQKPDSSYEVCFLVSLRNGFIISKEIIFLVTAQKRTPTATSSPTPTQSPVGITATPTDKTESGTSITTSKTATGFFELALGNSTTSEKPEITRIPSAYTIMSFGVSGKICVKNEGDLPTQGLKIVDQVEFKDDHDQYQPLPKADLLFPIDHQLAAGESRCFPYRIEFNPGTYTIFRNTVQVTITNHSGWLPGSKNCPGSDPCAFGPTTNVDFSLPSQKDPKVESTPVQPSDTPVFPMPSLTSTPSTRNLLPSPIVLATESNPRQVPTQTPTPVPPTSSETPAS